MAQIMVVDDEEWSRALLRNRLERSRHTVVTCPAADDALDRITRFGPPDVLVTDLFMPGASGHALVDALRRDPCAAQTPVVFLSARALPGDVAASHQRGGRFLAKPVHPVEFVATIAAVLSDAQEERTLSLLRQLPELADPAESELVADLLRRFPTSARTMADDVVRAVADDDPAEIGATTHRMQGAAATVGFGHLAALAARIGEASLTGEPTHPAAARTALDREIALVAIACRAAAAKPTTNTWTPEVDVAAGPNLARS